MGESNEVDKGISDDGGEGHELDAKSSFTRSGCRDQSCRAARAALEARKRMAGMVLTAVGTRLLVLMEALALVLRRFAGCTFGSISSFCKP